MGLPCGHTLSPNESAFLHQLLTPQTFRDLLKKTPHTLATNDIPPGQAPDPAALVQTLQESIEGIPAKNKVGISTVIADSDTSTSRYNQNLIIKGLTL